MRDAARARERADSDAFVWCYSFGVSAARASRVSRRASRAHFLPCAMGSTTSSSFVSTSQGFTKPLPSFLNLSSIFNPCLRTFSRSAYLVGSEGRVGSEGARRRTF